jgi:hypothetical protein
MSWFIIRTSPKRMKRIKGLARAGAYVLGLSAVLGVVQIRSARAEMANRTVELGREMMTLANASQHEVNKVNINGQQMWIGNSVAHDSAQRILDRYQAHCETNSAQPAAEWRAIADQPNAETSKRVPSTGVLRGGSGSEGSVLCFTKTPKSKQSIAEAMKAFAETGDLGAIGAARYAYVKTNSDTGNTHVLTAWTDETFSVFDLVGDETKDVPGIDFGGEIPRVPDSRRAFSARLEDSPFGVNVYHSKETPTNVAHHYDDQMQVQGWAAVDPDLEHKEPGSKAVARLYEKDNVVLTVASTPMSDDPKEGSYTVLGLAGAWGSSTAVKAGSESGAKQRQSFNKKD